MLRFFYDTRYKYTNRTLIDVSGDTSYSDIDYLNIDSPDTINGHIIYKLESGEQVPTYIIDLISGRRYFVSGITPLSANKKFQISLLRDILSEGDAWKEEESYIEAGVATDFNKYKRWNLPFTNTKIKEQRLNFGGKSSFFVFYVNEQSEDAHGNIVENGRNLKMAVAPERSIENYITVSNLNEIPGYEYVGAGDLTTFNYEEVYVQAKMLEDIIFRDKVNYVIYNSITDNDIYSTLHSDRYDTYNTINMSGSLYSNVESNANNCRNNIATAAANFYNNTYKPNHYTNPTALSNFSDLLNNYTNRPIVCGGYVYKIKYKTNTFEHHTLVNKSETASLAVAIQNINIPKFSPGSSTYQVEGNGFLAVNLSGTIYNFTIETLGNVTAFDINLTANTQKLPKSAVRCMNIVSGATASVTDEAISQALMLAQSNQYGLDANKTQIIDVQYLPFSIANTVSTYLEDPDDPDSEQIPYVSINGAGQYSALLTDDDFQFFTNMSDLTDINKETDTINIVSPSRQSQFMFRPYDNDGNMEFTTSVTIKPFSSTIYIRPSTKGLLQFDWQDKDCLVISEDFSLTKVSSAWADYVRSNKNYQRIFDRGLQSKAYERDWERRVEREQARSDDYNAKVLANQQVRNLTGNLPIVSTVAGLFSQGLSQLGGDNAYTRYMSAAQLDRQYNEAMYQESVALAQDQFNLQLENIKSQPLIPTNITTIDCKLLDGVYLEFYSTNPTEKQAIENFYKYNGNRIETFGTFNNYYGWFIKGKIIRAINYTQPEIDEVNRRLGIGIFTEVQYD